MVAGVGVGIAVGLLGLLATPALSYASFDASRTEIGVGTFLVIVALMAFLLLVYGIKVATGLEKELPPEEPAAPGHH